MSVSFRSRKSFLKEESGVMGDVTHEIKQFIKYWTFPVLRPRRFHAYGVGLAKSGTNSMHGIFRRRYRSRHEPERARFMEIIIAAAEGTLSYSEARAKVIVLNRKLWLEFNSSWLNYFMLDMLLDEYEDAKFILTIRDCYSTIDSAINNLLSQKYEPYHQNFRKWYASCFDVGPHRKEEQVLADLGFAPLDGWLNVWEKHNSTVLSKVPEDRLLVVRTKDIGNDLGRIAAFLGLPATTLDSSRSHEHKAAKKFDVLAKIEPTFLQEKVDEHCRALMDRYFPEIRQLSDVGGYGPSAGATQAEH